MLARFIQLGPFEVMSDKLKRRITAPRYVKEQTAPSYEDMELITFKKRHEAYGVFAQLFFLLDKQDGQVVDASYILAGPSYLVGALEAVIDCSLGQPLSAVAHLKTDKLDEVMRDFDHVGAFPKQGDAWLNFALEMVEGICAQCEAYIAMDPVSFLDEPPTPVGEMNLEPIKGFVWDETDHETREAVIDKVLKSDVRPYIQMDEGDIEIVSLKEHQLTVRYSGACVTCPSSIGATLSAISNILKKRVFEGIEVHVDMESLTL